MKGNLLLYSSAIIALAFSTLFSLMGPLVLRTTIDSIIGDQLIQNVPLPAISAVESIGGRSTLAQNLWIMSALLFVLAAANGTGIFLKGKWSAIASESSARNMRERLYDHLQRLPYDEHVKAQTGDLIQRCTSDLETIRRFLASQFIEVGRALFMIAVLLPIMISLSRRMTLVSLAATPVLFGFSAIFFSKIRKAFKISDEAEGEMSTVLQENLTGVRVVRAFGRQPFEIVKFDRENQNFRDTNYRLILMMARFWSLSDFISLFQIGVVVILGSYWASKGMISLGTFVAFSTYVGMLLWPIRSLGRILTDMGQTFVSLERIQEILDKPLENFRTNSKKPKIQGELEFSNVSFGYEADKLLLKNISFKIQPGKTVAILGPTGSGKSSLVHLLPALYDYKSGSIRLDGNELNTIDKEWLRQHVGIVLQEPFLYSKTLRDNIGIARAEARETEIFEAARDAAIHNVILEFEKGYDTPVGEKGVTLSGGQKQRVAISRTLLKKCPLLIFDDSLSAVDTETDAAIRKALNSNGRHATKIIISHRITTLSQADLILVLEHGEIVQSGTHAQLIAVPGLYQRIWAIQSSLDDTVENRKMKVA